MKNSFFVVLILMTLRTSVHAQTDSVRIAQQGIYLEIGGPGGYGSLNYERVLFHKQYLTVAARVGLSIYHVRDYTNQFNPDLIIPVSIGAYYGRQHNIEMAIGQTIANIVHAGPDFKPARKTDLHTHFSVGYRYQKNTAGFIFRCAYTPILEFNKHLRHWAGVSIGYSF